MLNFIRNYFNKVSLVAITVGAGIGFASANAETLPVRKLIDVKQSAKTVDASKFASSKKSNSPLGVKFEKVDSLANAFSCYIPSVNRSYMYSKEFSSLVFIKRGFFEKTSDGENNKNNLFVIKSADWGKTWGAPSLVFNANNENIGAARYPSVSCFTYENGFASAFAAPAVDEASTSGGWIGLITGLKSDGGTVVSKRDDYVDINGEQFNYSTTNRIIAIPDKSGKDVITILEVAPISPENTANLQEANGFIFRKYIDFSEDAIKEVPPQWASSNFNSVSQAGYRSNELVDFIQGPDNKLYLGVHGGFSGVTSSQKIRPAVSISADLGTTWSDFAFMSDDVMKAFTVAQGYPADSSGFSWASKGFTVLDNGDCSFVLTMSLYDASAAKSSSRIVEAIYSQTNKDWKLRNVTEFSGSYMTYSDVTDETTKARQNASDYELQVARTEDGKTLVAKWVDVVNIDTAAGTWTTDIFVASRAMSSDTWVVKGNITQSPELDRSTLLPDVVPNDISKLPIMKLITVTPANMSETDYATEQFKAQIPQYLMKMVYTTDGVNDDPTTEPCDCTKLDLQKITPNPSNTENMVTVSFFMPKKAVIDINLYDYTGKLVSDLRDFDKEYDEKSNSIQINMQTINNGAIPVGSYYISIETLGQKVTKLLTVVK